MSDNKDRFGDKVRDLEKAREDQWASQRDRELLENLRRKQAELKSAMSAATETIGMLCPRCHQALVKGEQKHLALLSCPNNDGAWIDQVELDRLLGRVK